MAGEQRRWLGRRCGSPEFLLGPKRGRSERTSEAERRDMGSGKRAQKLFLNYLILLIVRFVQRMPPDLRRLTRTPGEAVAALEDKRRSASLRFRGSFLGKRSHGFPARSSAEPLLIERDCSSDDRGDRG